MATKKQNCWEHSDCGRHPGGHKVADLGVCPAATDTSFDGINSGIAGGRICWAVAGTFCGGTVQGSFAEKRDSCTECDFFRQVREEEGSANFSTKFLNFISFRDGKESIFKHETYKYIKAGERFITQGEVGDTAYIIQRGTCLVIVEKDSELHPVNHYGVGDIVGGVGLLTGEPHIAHVEAETDLEAWALTRADFDRISEKDPEMLNFLTEFVANRFDSRRPTAYRTIGKYVANDIIGRGGFSEDFNFSGTAAYISPEQIEGDPVDERTDIYGLGVVAYEMVTGAKPFQAETVQDLFDLHLRQDIPDPAERVPDLPDELRRFIMKAARSDPDQRYQNVGEVLEEIRPLTARISTPGRHEPLEKQKMTNILLMYRDRDQHALARLMEEFSAKAAELGVVLKVSELHDL